MRALLALLLLAPATASQPLPESLSGIDGRVLTVAGDGVAVAAPDRAVLQFAVMSQEKEAADALRANEEAALRVLTAVRRFGIADRQINLLGLQLRPDYRDRGQPEGYAAYRTVRVVLDDLRAVPDLVATVVAEGVNQFEQLEYIVREYDPLEDRALEAAIARARERAQIAADAAGVTLGAVRQVQEQGVYVVPMHQGMNAMAESAVAVTAGGTPGAYSAGEVQVQARVLVQFDITRPGIE